MDVLVDVVRHVVVNDVHDVLDVETPGGDAGGHEHGHAAGLEVGQGLLALRLQAVPVDAGDRMSATVYEKQLDLVPSLIPRGQH